MNITITIDELDMGGAQHVVYQLLQHIDLKKYIITIICTEGSVPSLLQKSIANLSVQIIFLSKFTHKKPHASLPFINKIYNKFFSLISELYSIAQLSHAVKKSNPDIVFAHQRGIWAAYWAIFNKTYTVTTIHTTPSVDATFPRISEKIIFWLSIRLKKNIVVAISKYNLELIKKFWHIQEPYALCINNGVNIADFYHTPHNTFAFINVARQDENKNQSLIIRSFARLTRIEEKSLKLFLIGDGVLHEKLMHEAENLHIAHCVEFTGYIETPKEYLARSDVYISSAKREGLSLAVLEAMASGLPVIATDAGGVRDLAEDNGILISVDDEDALFAAMKQLLHDDKMRKIMGQKSLAKVQDFSADTMCTRYCALFEKYAKKA
jgi:glycosyltransferase involved in cell wall biosynthesis